MRDGDADHRAVASGLGVRVRWRNERRAALERSPRGASARRTARPGSASEENCSALSSPGGLLGEQPGVQVEHAAHRTVACERSEMRFHSGAAAARSARRDRGRRPPSSTAGVEPRRGASTLPRVPRQPVGERQQRLVRALELACIDVLDAKRPAGVGRHDRQRAAPAQRDLVLEQPPERGGPAADREHPGRNAGRLDPDRRHRGAGGGVDRAASSRCPARPPSGPSSSPTISTCSGAMPRAPQMREAPAGGVGLVGEADLDVLGVARHTCVGQPGLGRGASPELDRRAQPVEPVLAQPRLRRPRAARRCAPSADPPTRASGSGRSCGG